MERFTTPPFIKKYFEIFKNAGYELYLVGGAVRNIFLNKQTTNWDFATNAKPQEIQALFPHSFYHNTFGTVTVMEEVEGIKLPIEITTYRIEQGYSDKRRPDKVHWTHSLEADLSRRDFTVNAMALTFIQDKAVIVDPFGGKDDIQKKLVRAVGEPQQRFQEDALRLMRGVRLASELGFTIEQTTLDAIIKNAHLIQTVSGERIRDELLRILTSSAPHEGILLLRKAGLLKEILPELEACFGVEQKSPGRHHIYDVGTHSVLALSFCESTHPITRLATLLHDIGKAPTFKKDPVSGLITFYNHEVVGANMAADIANRLKLSKNEKTMLVTLIRHHMFTVSEKMTDSAVKRFIRNVGVENLNEIIMLRVADRLGSGAKATSWRTELFKKRLIEVQKEPFSVRDLKINGEDVMREYGIGPGPKVGQALQLLFEKVEKGELKNERDYLLEELRRLPLR